MGNSNSKSKSKSLHKNNTDTTDNTNKISNNTYDNPQDFTKLSLSNAVFITKLNEIASTYILEQNFQDMIRLTNPSYCDDLVGMTSEILNQSYDDSQINYAYQVIYKKGQGPNTSGASADPLHADALKSKEVKTKMCINIAKYYVKIAHLFAAIMTTLNPVFSWKTSASSKRAVTKPVIDKKDTIGMEEVVNGGDDSDDQIEEEEKEEKGEKPEKSQEIQYSTLEDKHEISQMAKDIKVENLNFCNSRVSDLMDMDDISSLFDGTNSISGTNGESVIKIKPRLCSSSLNNNNEGYSRHKSVYDLPGFPELSRLYFDRYNSSKKRFDRMSKESENEKKRNVALLYTLFTGNKNPPQDIKSFRDIPLHSFAETIECDNPESALNKIYIGTTKDKLFVDYVEQIKKMIYESNMIRNSLLEIIDRIFIPVRGSESSQGDESETKPKFTINSKLSAKDLNDCIEDTRRIILRLYITCEKDFIKALKILQSIVEAQILETNNRQIKDLEMRIERQNTALPIKA